MQQTEDSDYVPEASSVQESSSDTELDGDSNGEDDTNASMPGNDTVEVDVDKTHETEHTERKNKLGEDSVIMCPRVNLQRV